MNQNTKPKSHCKYVTLTLSKHGKAMKPSSADLGY
jgi:hypothetical protein